MRAPALARIGSRDPHDWQKLACALQLNCPIWTKYRGHSIVQTKKSGLAAEASKPLF
jgi:predicted nucleic acid-binding protein